MASHTPFTTSVIIDLPTELYNEVNTELTSRGSSIQTFVRMMLRSQVRNQKVYKLTDTMKFGKFSGENVEALIRTDPDYINWLLENTTRFALAPDACQLLEQITSADYERMNGDSYEDVEVEVEQKEKRSPLFGLIKRRKHE